MKKLKKLPPLFHASYCSVTMVEDASFAISSRNLLFSFKKSYRNWAVLSSTEKGRHSKASGLPISQHAFLQLVFWKQKCTISSQQHLLGSETPGECLLMATTVFFFFFFFSLMYCLVCFSFNIEHILVKTKRHYL